MIRLSVAYFHVIATQGFEIGRPFTFYSELKALKRLQFLIYRVMHVMRNIGTFSRELESHFRKFQRSMFSFEIVSGPLEVIFLFSRGTTFFSTPEESKYNLMIVSASCLNIRNQFGFSTMAP